jgi:hypothetical protein
MGTRFPCLFFETDFSVENSWKIKAQLASIFNLLAAAIILKLRRAERP